ncbi:DUF5996 family protein [Streptomyces sp. NPDC005480]|uniref:DUF5996 family protein n=1 Tax=Streptomyces sp. NPDC005480 TaxID=3154880 RepID=UPI0033B1B46D
MSERRTAWPELVYEDVAPMVAYVNRLVQVGGKYTLDEPFEAGWGNIVLDVTFPWAADADASAAGSDLRGALPAPRR